MTTLTFTEALDQAAALARQALPTVLHVRLDDAVALIKDGRVHQTADLQLWTVDSASTDGKTYQVNGRCECEDATYRALQGRCKHKLSVLLARKTLELIHQTPETSAQGTPPTATLEASTAVGGIDPRYIVHIQGTAYVKYAGLLALAHQ